MLLAHPENRLELRLEPADGFSLAEGFALASEALKQYFSAQGVADVTITLASEAPSQHETSGKFKHIINLDA